MNNERNLVRPGLWATKKQIPKIKKRLREKVPKVSGYEFGEDQSYYTIFSYMNQNGLRRTTDFVKNLISTEEELLVENKENPLLTVSKKLVIQIAATAIDIDKDEATILDLVSLAHSVDRTSKTSMWLVIKIFEYALNLASEIRVDRGYMETKIRYAYAKYLIEKNQTEKACEILGVAYKLALDKPWHSDYPNRTLFNDINNALFQGYMQHAEQVRATDLELAIKLSKMAETHSLAAKNNEATSKVKLLRAKLEFEKGHFENALSLLDSAVHYAEIGQISVLVCEANLMKGLCFNAMGDRTSAMACARLVKRKIGLRSFAGRSSMLMAQINMGLQKYLDAGVNCMEALDEFILINDGSNASRARCHGGYAFAHAIFPVYNKLIKKLTNSDSEIFLKRLVLWKDKHVTFWKEYEGNIFDDLLTSDVGSYGDYKVERFSLFKRKLVCASTQEKPMVTSIELSTKVHRPTFHKGVISLYRNLVRTTFSNV